MLASYLVSKGLSEEEAFWVMAHLIEEVIPREYYSTMISLTADINMLLLFLSAKYPKIHKHLLKVNFELPMVLVELFITIFTTNTCEITDLIMDMVLIEGSQVYFKAILTILGYFEKEILQTTEFCNLVINRQSSFFNLSRENSEATPRYSQSNSRKIYKRCILVGSSLKSFVTSSVRRSGKYI